MFQTYNVISDYSKSSTRIELLRNLLKKNGLNGYIVPLSDEYQGEYIAAYAQRLQWLTGFTGSAGMALILLDKAIFFTDRRYSLQVRQQTDNNIFSYVDSTDISIAKYLELNIKDAKIAIDSALFTIAQAKALKVSLEKTNSKLIYPNENLVDNIWEDQPLKPITPVVIHQIKYSGKDSKQKILEIQEIMIQNKCDNIVLTDATSIAWLFNIRGNDVEHTPVTLAFACVSATTAPTLFINKEKLDNDVYAYLNNICNIADSTEFLNFINTKAEKGENFGLDANSCAEQVYANLAQHKTNIQFIRDPIKLAKAVKNKTEIEGARQAHIRDGVAMVRFLCWLYQQKANSVDEISAAKQLEKFRKITAIDFKTELKDISFDSISGCGEHGAIIHYRVNEQTNKILQQGELYLIDSGAQYLDGTTDITRTIALGNVGLEEKKCFTLVLKGLINLSMARFLPHTKGLHLDILARNALLQHGLDYAHGTGHGVGSYLGVHEGPQSITRLSEQELLTNMIISNEPGYYKAGHFGIRIENLIVVNSAQKANNEEVATHSFETLTLCPIDISLIEKNLLNKQEILWINNYHKFVYSSLAKYLDETTKEWLQANTQPI